MIKLLYNSDRLRAYVSYTSFDYQSSNFIHTSVRRSQPGLVFSFREREGLWSPRCCSHSLRLTFSSSINNNDNTVYDTEK